MKRSNSYRGASRASLVLLWVSFGLSLMIFALVTWGMFLNKKPETVWPLYVAMPIGLALHTAGLVGAMLTKRFGWWFFALSLLGAIVLGAHALTLFRELSVTTVYAGGAMSDFSMWKLMYRHLIPVLTSLLLFWRLYARAHAESQELAQEIAKSAKETREKRIFKD